VRIINKELRIPRFQLANRRHCRQAQPDIGQIIAPARPSIELRRVAKFNRNITSEGPGSHMARSQFPDELIDAQGRTIRRPANCKQGVVESEGRIIFMPRQNWALSYPYAARPPTRSASPSTWLACGSGPCRSASVRRSC
jgi:hypothetical protein